MILNAHTRSYERFAPQDPGGNLDNAYGIREFMVATGGAPLETYNTDAANSEAWQASTLGVLEVTFHATSYDWQFVPVAGGSYSDAGTGNCHADKPNLRQSRRALPPRPARAGPASSPPPRP